MNKIRFFKPGTRVIVKGYPKSPVMEVIKYIDDSLVQCVYFKNGQRYKESFNEKILIKTDKPGLFKL